MMKILIILIAAFSILLIAFSAYAQSSNLEKEVNSTLGAILNRIKYAFETLDAWLNKVIGINFTKIFNFIVKVVVWFLDLIVKLFKWVRDFVF